jgi:energy-coupling factor transporter ATP-binding protein EcfA2
MRGSVAPLLALGTGFNHHLTGRENAMIELLTLGMTRAQAQRELVDVIAFSELEEFIDAPLRTYSTGMAMRLAFAAAIRVDPDILLLDEILAVGDERFARKCTTWMDDFRRRGKTTILVTHSSTVVATQCDVALWLDNGRVAAYGDRMDVVRAYVQAKSGRPVAETIGTDVEELEAAKALVASYRQRLSGIMPLLRIPLVGFVRQLGSIKGMYEDGWTDGALEFSLSPLRDVRAWTVHATVPAGTPPGSKMTVELDGTAVLVSTVEAGPVVLACESPLPKGRAAKIRIASSATVNHHAMGISGDLREMGPRIDEIVFDHDT